MPGPGMIKRVIRLIMAGCAVVSLGACTRSPSRELIQEYGHHNESPARFGVCKGYGCATSVRITLTPPEWETVRAAFGSPPPDAVSEREAIRRAIGRIERLVGPRTGTADDKPGAQIINFKNHNEMDCIDESFNTTTYLRFLEQDGLILWHSIGLPVRRGSFIDRWPHNTATIQEKASATDYAVDSWFHGNGIPPDVVALDLWLKGWTPDVVYDACGNEACAAPALQRTNQ